jgi:1,4-dihydroxy-2-naphthoyl-CoA hydrolase
MPDPDNTQPVDLLRGQEPPFAANLGVEIVAADDEQVAAELQVTDAMRNRNGLMHGGAMMAFVDCLCGTAATHYMPADRVTSTIESKTNFLRAIRIGEQIRAVCRPRHRGRTTMVFEIEVYAEDGRLAALATQTQILLPR